MGERTRHGKSGRRDRESLSGLGGEGLSDHAMRRGFIICALALFLAPPARAAELPPMVVSHGDAYIAHADGSNAWHIGGATLDRPVGFDQSGTLAIQSLSNPGTGRFWNITPAADATITIGSETVTLGTSGSTSFTGVSTEETDNGVRLTFNFE